MKTKKGIILLFVLTAILLLTSVFADGDGEKSFGFLSILPPLIAIILSFTTKQVILSLFIGVFVGAIILNNGNIVVGFVRTLDQYMVGSIADGWNAAILVFTLSIGGLIGIISKMGGSKAIAEWLAKKAKTPRSAQILTSLLGIFIFFDDYANSLIVGPTMRPLSDKMRISREKLSFIVDSTAAPVTCIALISTWVGYQLGLIQDVFTNLGISTSAYNAFISSIPYSFYAIAAIAMVFVSGILLRDFGPMYKAELRARKTGKVLSDTAKPMISKELTDAEVSSNVVPKIHNALVPILLLIASCVVSLYFNGRIAILGGEDQTLMNIVKSSPFSADALRNIFSNADASVSLVWATIFTVIVTITMAVSQRILKLGEALDAFVDGSKSLLITCIILTFAWSLGAVSREIGTANYIIQITQGILAPALVPMLIFIVSCLISFATGTSWGTMAIVIPIAIPLAYTLGEANMTLVYATLGCVLTGAVYGDHCSPISDTTIMSSMGSACDHMDHVKTQLPYATVAAIVAAILGYLPAGLGLHPVFSIVLIIAGIWAVLRFYGKSTNPKHLKIEE